MNDPNDPNDPLAAVLALTVFDDGPGEALFAGGKFTMAGGRSAAGVARWDASTWSELGVGVPEDPNTPAAEEVAALVGWGDTLYVGGNFVSAGGQEANRIAEAQRDPNDPNHPWIWSALGAGVSGDLPCTVATLVVSDYDGSEALYVGGKFTYVDDTYYVHNVARWNFPGWEPLGDGPESKVLALAVYDDGQTRALFAGGKFTRADGVCAPHVARYHEGTWSPLGRAPNYPVFALCDLDAWDGPALYVGGDFDSVGELRAAKVARWDGSTWRALGDGLDYCANALAPFDYGQGLDLYVGGGAQPRDQAGSGDPGPGYIAKGRMLAMQQQGKPVTWGWFWGNTVSCDKTVFALAEFQDANDPSAMLYAGGNFTFVDGVQANHIARWNGTAWAQVADGLSNPVMALTLADLGDGAALYVASGSTVQKWKDNTWSQFSPGPDVGVVQALAAFEGTLYAGGNGTRAVAQWDGASWDLLGWGVSGGQVLALQVYDDGRGDALYVGGWLDYGYNTDPNDPNFDPNDPNDVAYSPKLLRWDGQLWEAVGFGVGDHVYALPTFHDGLGPRPPLYVGGHLHTAGTNAWADTDSDYIARWGCGGMMPEADP